MLLAGVQAPRTHRQIEISTSAFILSSRGAGNPLLASTCTVRRSADTASDAVGRAVGRASGKVL
jgi:hypothetical protein